MLTAAERKASASGLLADSSRRLLAARRSFRFMSRQLVQTENAAEHHTEAAVWGGANQPPCRAAISNRAAISRDGCFIVAIASRHLGVPLCSIRSIGAAHPFLSSAT